MKWLILAAAIWLAASGAQAQFISGGALAQLAPTVLDCDGVTDNAARVTSANSKAGLPLTYPTVTPSYTTPCVANLDFMAGTAYNLVSGKYGRMEDSAGNLRANEFANETADPVKLGTYADTFSARFNYDTSKHINTWEKRLGSSVATTGSGYVIANTVGAFRGSFINNGGFSSNINSNADRSGIPVWYMQAQHNGAGDLILHWPNCVTSKGRTYPGGTIDGHWQGEPACSLRGGTVTAGIAGTYLDIDEQSAIDSGFDSSASGIIRSFNRTAGTAAMGRTWFGTRLQSIGTVPIDGYLSIAGPARIGLHMNGLVFDEQMAAGAVTITPGSGVCAVGDVLRVVGGTFTTPARIQVTTVNGSNIPTAAVIYQQGGYSVTPSNPVSVTVESNMGTSTCTDHTFTIAAWKGNAAITLKAGDRIYWNAAQGDTVANGTGLKKYPNYVNVGTTYTHYDTTKGYQWYLGDSLIKQAGPGGHQFWGGSVPTLSACGTNPAIIGTDSAGSVTFGTASPTGCTITFGTAFAAAPICTVTWRANLASMAYTVSTTALTLTQTATSSNLIDYRCTARNSDG